MRSRKVRHARSGLFLCVSGVLQYRWLVLLPDGMAAALLIATRATSAARFLNCMVYSIDFLSCIFWFSDSPRTVHMKGVRVLYIWTISLRALTPSTQETAKEPLTPYRFFYERIIPAFELGSRSKVLLVGQLSIFVCP
jgi:hypothetical protein